MAIPRDALRYPAKRVLLARTRLAYVHLRNLLTDAKRDRAARVCGYVAVWLPEELITLFLEEGEVVNATSSHDGEHFQIEPFDPFTSHLFLKIIGQEEGERMPLGGPYLDATQENAIRDWILEGAADN